jgi:hypothetical protein
MALGLGRHQFAMMTPIGQSEDARASTLAQRWHNAGNDACVMLVMTPVQDRRGLQRNTSKDTRAASAGLSKADHHAMMLGKAMKPLAMTTNTASLSHTLACCCYVMSGQMPVCVAVSIVWAARVTTLAQRGQRRLCVEGDNAGATPVTVTVRCWQ